METCRVTYTRPSSYQVLFMDLLKPQKEWFVLLPCCPAADLTCRAGLWLPVACTGIASLVAEDSSSHLSYAQVSLIRILEKSNQTLFLLP